MDNLEETPEQRDERIIAERAQAMRAEQEREAATGYYRDDAGAVYFLDDGAFRHLLPESLTKITDEEGKALEAANTPPPDLAADLLAVVEAHMDSVARVKGYNDRYTAALRAAYPGPFRAEGTAFAEWMDATYAYLYQLQDAVQLGNEPLPAREALLPMLPAAPWPKI